MVISVVFLQFITITCQSNSVGDADDIFFQTFSVDEVSVSELHISLKPFGFFFHFRQLFKLSESHKSTQEKKQWYFNILEKTYEVFSLQDNYKTQPAND